MLWKYLKEMEILEAPHTAQDQEFGWSWAEVLVAMSFFEKQFYLCVTLKQWN